jgi:hypothetical protein
MKTKNESSKFPSTLFPSTLAILNLFRVHLSDTQNHEDEFSPVVELLTLDYKRKYEVEKECCLKQAVKIRELQHCIGELYSLLHTQERLDKLFSLKNGEQYV